LKYKRKRKIQNKVKGQVYYGLHFTPGVAEYAGEGQDGKASRIFISGNTAKEMDSSFQGCPVFVDHKEEIDKHDFTNADGYVSESFFNKSDGCHWAKFVVTTEAGEAAINANGWVLSNAYYPTGSKGGGVWHGVKYDEEVIAAEYEHLAIVQNPRYTESMILTPEQFKAYNLENDSKLLKLANSSEQKINRKNKGVKGMFKFFTRERVENSDSLENTVVVLPKSEKEISITELVKNADALELTKNDKKIINGDETVMVNEKEMSVNELKEAYENMCAEKAENEAEDKKENDDDKKENDDESKENEDDKKENDDDKKENDDEDKKENDDDKKENEDDEEDHMENDESDKKSNSKKKSNHSKMLNADKVSNEAPKIVLTSDKVALGKARYGSN